VCAATNVWSNRAFWSNIFELKFELAERSGSVGLRENEVKMKATDGTEYSLDVPKATSAVGNPLLGTWKLQSLVFEVIGTGQRSSPMGDHPSGYLSYSLDGRMYAIGVAENRPNPRDLVPTDEEKVKLQETIFAYAGTYSVDAQKVIHHVDISWNQSWTGTDLVRFYKLNDNILTITTAPVQDATDGKEGRFILVWERVQ
jgi:hypothetical protein